MRCLCSSMPVIVGIWTSAIKQLVSMRRGQARKSAAEEKTATLYPSDVMSLLMDSRKYLSSSTTEINDVSGIGSGTSLETAVRTAPNNVVAPPCEFHNLLGQQGWGR